MILGQALRLSSQGTRCFVKAALVALAVAGLSPPAQAAAERCEVVVTPEFPGVSAEAFSRLNVYFSATAVARCFDAYDDPVAEEVCIAARREPISGSVDMVRGSVTIPYTLTVDGIAVTSQNTEIWSGLLDSAGRSFSVEYAVRADAFSGYPSGVYQTSLTWTLNYNPSICG